MQFLYKAANKKTQMYIHFKKSMSQKYDRNKKKKKSRTTKKVSVSKRWLLKVRLAPEQGSKRAARRPG